MPLLQSDFAKEDSLSAIWEIKESEEELQKMCSLTDYDKDMLKDIGSEHRRIEILIVRVLLKILNPELSITYNGRKPLCNYGFISITHSNSLVAVIWHPTKKTTIDIEHISDRIKRIAKRAFNESELNFAGDNTELLTKIWSCKECIFKIADEEGIDFSKQIFVSEFSNNSDIDCNLILSSEKKSYTLKHTSFLDHVLVWGIK